MATYDETLADTLGIARSPVACFAPHVRETLRTSGQLTPQRAHNPAIEDTIAVAETLAALTGINLYDLLTISEPHVVNHFFHMELAERAALTERLQRTLPLTISEDVGVAAASVATFSLRLIDMLGLAPALLPSLIYTHSVQEGIRVAAAIARFFGAEALDELDLADTPIGTAYKAAIMAEAVTIAEEVEPRFLLRVQVTDDVHTDDADLVQMAFNGAIAEGVEITAGFILPGTAFTTWAMNTRTGAVSEYRNYEFNSFARVGNIYVGASDDGLYELVGEDDDGEDIIATIRSGYAQWAGAHLHSFKAAYLAVRGSGEFVLRVITPDGKTYNYTVTAESMKTVKINMGKGLRSRYFAFELVSSGQDFDLETLEFIPLVAQRRV